MMDLLKSGRIEYPRPGLVMLYRSTAYFKRHVLTDDSRLTCDIVRLGLIAFLEQSQGKDECGEPSYNVVLMRT